MAIYFRKIENKNGFAAMASVLFVGAIALVAILSIIGSSNSLLRQNYFLQKSVKAQSLAHSCAELALQQVRNSTSFEGNGSKNTSEGSCEYVVVNDGEEKRTIQSEGVVNDIIFRVIVKVDGINPKINITYWEEIDNF